MVFLIRFLNLILVLFFTSCSFLNNPAVQVTIDSDPAGAKIYVDDVYYGTTTKAINVVPTKKNRHLRIEKDGYKAVDIEMESKFSMRRGREGYSNCKMDLLGSFLILPIFGLKSIHCRSFTKELYSVELSAIVVNRPSQDSVVPQDYTPFSTRSYYFPPQTQEENKNTISTPDISQINQAQQPPIFNNQSEFINNGNEAGLNRNFNHKSKIDYYNWQ
jgi:hypothetical protein